MSTEFRGNEVNIEEFFMAIRIQTTHIWTKIFIPIVWVSRICAICVVISLIEAMIPNETFAGILMFIAFFATIVLHALFIEQYYHIIQTWLYIRLNLGTNVSLSEARHFLLLFAPSELGSWYPMTGIKDVPKEYRREVLYESTHKIYVQLGYEFDSTVIDSMHKSKSNTIHNSIIQDEFVCLIGLLSKLAKSDGVVSKEEVEIIDDFFLNFVEFDKSQREEAIRLFNQFKDDETPFEVHARRFYESDKGNTEKLESVILLLASIAFADGHLSSEEEILIQQAISIFNVDENVYNSFKAKYHRKSSTSKKEEVYANVLGLEDDHTPSVIKSAYRRLAVKYHPDKVSHLGDKIREIAEQEMKKINEAYEYFQEKYGIV